MAVKHVPREPFDIVCTDHVLFTDGQVALKGTGTCRCGHEFAVTAALPASIVDDEPRLRRETAAVQHEIEQQFNAHVHTTKVIPK